MWGILEGDAIANMKTFDDGVFDSIVTDPPYGLEFMGKEWDKYTPGQFQNWCEQWAREAYRVLQPGGYLVAFGGTRTYHRLAAGIEDAGFEIRDSLHWIYGSGFPKSLNISKAVDNLAEPSRELSRDEARFCEWMRNSSGLTEQEVKRLTGSARFITGEVEIINTATVDNPHMGRRAMVPTAAAWAKILPHLKSAPPDWITALVKEPPHEQSLADWNQGKGQGTVGSNEWEGWGTALKPAHEPIILARKPLAAKTVAANVLEYGTGGINVDGCRVDYQDQADMDHARVPQPALNTTGEIYNMKTGEGRNGDVFDPSKGRWPPNIILTHSPWCVEDGTCSDECPAAEMDRQSGTLVSGSRKAGVRKGLGFHGADGDGGPAIEGNSGGASRFFPVFRYQAKAPKSERPTVAGVNAHPTVKPVALMRWLVKLVTPPGGVVLDPFGGSGTTAEACVLEGFDCVLIEREPDYLKLIDARMSKREEAAA